MWIIQILTMPVTICKLLKLEKAAGLNYANVQIFTADMFNFTDAGFNLRYFHQM